jgi:ADP-heptose:LPS heptosyltransferase
MTVRCKLALDYYLGSLLHVLLTGPTRLLGLLLQRDHDLSHCSSVTFIKMLGGGSLVIAYPSLIALRNCPRIKTLRLVTTPAIRPFAEILGIFDEIIVIRETSLAVMVFDSIRALWKLFRCDAVVDLEVHSRFSTVFSLLTCARNRVGFYTSFVYWRKGSSTHLIFCNPSSSIHYFYDQIASLFGGIIPHVDAFREAFTSQLPQAAERALTGAKRVAIAPCCSDLGKERQLTAGEWLAILRDRMRIGQFDRSAEIYLMGSPSDRNFLNTLADLICEGLPGVKAHNLAGRTTLAESVAWLQQMNLLFCIDSAMLHFGRLIGVTTISYWGPTSPATRLRPDMVPAEEVFYRPIPCSPCVHVTESPPCNGASACMRSVAVIPESVGALNPIWLVGVNDVPSAKTAKVAPPQRSLKAGRLPVIGGDLL